MVEQVHYKSCSNIISFLHWLMMRRTINSTASSIRLRIIQKLLKTKLTRVFVREISPRNAPSQQIFIQKKRRRKLLSFRSRMSTLLLIMLALGERTSPDKSAYFLVSALNCSLSSFVRSRFYALHTWRTQHTTFTSPNGWMSSIGGDKEPRVSRYLPATLILLFAN